MRMKIIYLIVLLPLILSSCQPTPTEPIVVSKDDGTLQKTVYGIPAPLGKYNAPDVWQEDIDTSKSGEEYLKIQFEAQITVPNSRNGYRSVCCYDSCIVD